jgi:hypothetical protein
MFTSVVLVALASFVAHEEMTVRPTWLKDYSLASERGLALQKPLAVFIGTGETGWDDVSKDGNLGRAANELLAANYVCIYLDTNKEEGRHLAKAFAITDGVGMVLSDRKGKLQAFHQEGEIDAKDLEKSLRRYADPDRVAKTTETREDLQPRPVRPAQPTVRYAPVTRSC